MPCLPAEGILALHDQKLRDPHDLKVGCTLLVDPHAYLLSCYKFCTMRFGPHAGARDAVRTSKVSLTSSAFFHPALSKVDLGGSSYREHILIIGL